MSQNPDEPTIEIRTRANRAGKAVTAFLGVGALALSTGCANHAGPARTSPIQASQPEASAPAPVAGNAQAMWAVLTSLPSPDVAVIAPGLDPSVRDDLHGIILGVAGSIDH